MLPAVRIGDIRRIVLPLPATGSLTLLWRKIPVTHVYPHTISSGFLAYFPPPRGYVTVSIKFRAVSGHFGRSVLYLYYDLGRFKLDRSLVIKEDESGPEIRLFVRVGATLPTSTFKLITEIIWGKIPPTRSDVKKSADPIQLIVCCSDHRHRVREEIVARFSPRESVNSRTIARLVNKSVQKFFAKEE